MTTRRSLISTAAFALCQCVSTTAFAQEDSERAQVTFSVKVWNSSWATAMPTVYTGLRGNGTPGLSESLDEVEGGNRTTAFPALAVRKGKYFLSGSYARYSGDFHAPSSSIIAANGANIATSRDDHITRKESDVALGYLVSPTLAFTLGYKDVKEDRYTALGIGGNVSNPNYHYKASGVIGGVVANFQVHGPLRFYGQLGYGPGRVKASFTDPSIAASKNNARYLVSEMGLNYALRIMDDYIKGASVGLGYRSQVVRTKGVAPAYRNERDYRDTKDGVIFSLNVAI